MVKLLEMQESLIDVFTGYACTIPIFINKPEGKKWFIQNYLNYMITYDEKYDHVVSDYFYSDFTYNSAINFYQPENIVNFPYSCYSAPTSMICNIIEFIKQIINSGFYVCLYVNLKYLSKYCLKEDLIHEIFIYGYDDNQQLIYSSGYMQRKKYSLYTHTYNEFVMSYEKRNVNSPMHIYFDTQRISYFKYKDNFEYNFELSKFVDTLKEYLSISTDYKSIKRYICYTNEKSNEKITYGIESIKVLIKYLQNINEKQTIDLRQIYFLYNHKINMKFKMEYLMDIQYIMDKSILENYQEIIHDSKICLNYCIKYTIKPKKEYIVKMILYLKEIYIKEKNVLLKVIELLEKS